MRFLIKTMTPNAFLKLPFQFSEERLLHDLSICESYSFVTHMNQQDYEGSWTSIALRSLDGSKYSIVAEGSKDNKFKNTPLLDECLYFKEVLERFECELESVRLLSLAPGSVIKKHRDRGLCYSDGCFRLHVPIATNDQVIFKFEGVPMKMQTGSCWYGNFDLMHEVENNGNQARIHLVIDGIRNNWTDLLFKKAGYDFQHDEKKLDKNTQIQMLAELERMDNEAAKQMAQSIRDELGI